MFPRKFLASALAGAALSLMACSSPVAPSMPVSRQLELTPARAKEALLVMMRSKSGKELGWFNGDIPDQMAKTEIEAEDDGWFSWSAAFHFNPAKSIYVFNVRPRPGVRARFFEYNGTFVNRNGRWVATPPELVSTAMQNGD